MSAISELCCARIEFNRCSTQNYSQVPTNDSPPPLHEAEKEKGTLNPNCNVILSRKNANTSKSIEKISSDNAADLTAKPLLLESKTD